MEQLQKKFDILDKNKDGQINKKEMIESLTGLGGMTENQAMQIVEEIFAEADKDRSGELNITEFIAIRQKKNFQA